MSTATTQFDLARFTRATEERDASTQVSMYAPDANVTVIDCVTQPSSPRLLRGRTEIEGWIIELTARDLTHSVQHTVNDESGAAFTVDCRYPNGTGVLCATVLQLAEGAIVQQTVVQAWDEG